MAGERELKTSNQSEIQWKTHTYQEDKTNVGIIQNKDRWSPLIFIYNFSLIIYREVWVSEVL